MRIEVWLAKASTILRRPWLSLGVAVDKDTERVQVSPLKYVFFGGDVKTSLKQVWRVATLTGLRALEHELCPAEPHLRFSSMADGERNTFREGNRSKANHAACHLVIGRLEDRPSKTVQPDHFAAHSCKTMKQ